MVNVSFAIGRFRFNVLRDGDMIQDGFDTDPERALALSYAAPGKRAALSALLGLDDALAALMRTTTEPAVAQIRLAWWREQVGALNPSSAIAMPVLDALARHVVADGIDAARLVDIVEGWEILVEAERMDDAALSAFAEKRGGGLFAIGGELLRGSVPRGAGEGWALADLARHLDADGEAGLARQMATQRSPSGLRWPRETRALGALAAVATMNLAIGRDRQPAIASPRRVARLAWMRLTGR